MRRAAVLLLLGVSACTSAAGVSGRFTGPVTPVTPGPFCAVTRADLQIRDGQVIFAPDEGTWVLDGVITSDNVITADKSRVAPNNQVYNTTFEGRLSGNVITGRYKTPRCSSTATLTRR